MPTYSINTLETLSGIKAHTIRMWEHRFGLLKPGRTPTNIRFYNDAQLKKFLNVATLLQNGFRISKVSQLTTTELQNEVDIIINSKGEEPGRISAFVNQLVASGLTLDGPGFETTYARIKEDFNTEDIFFKVLLPLMKILLYEWNKSKISRDKKHFLINLLRQKLLSAIDGLPIPENMDERWLLFLPPNEYQDIALLYAHFLLRNYNRSVLYLGSNVPVIDVKKVAKKYNPTHSLFLFYSAQTERAGEKYIGSIQSALPDSELIVSGNSPLITKLKKEVSVTIIEKLSDFKEQYLI